MTENNASSGSTQLATVEALIAAWKCKDVQGVLDLLCEDVEYHFLVGERPLVGKEWVARFLDRFKEHIGDTNDWRIARHAEAGNLLLIEGIDDFVDAEGTHIRYPYMGAFEFRDGLIHRWRDYADRTLIADQRAGKALPDWLVPLVA